MRTKGRTRAGFGLAAGLVMASIVGITSMTASGADGDLRVPYGTLTIDLSNRAGTVTLDRFGDGATFTQPLTTTQPCATLVTGGELLRFTPNDGEPGYSVQLPGDALGVHQGENCGGPAGLIGPGERLEIALGSLSDFLDDGVTVGSASLVIGKTHPQDGSLQLAFDDGPFGASISIGNSGGTVAVTDTSFTSVTLRSTASQNSRGLSLRSGTVLNLVVPSEFDEAVDCGESASTEDEDSDVATSVEYLRLENIEKSVDDPPCEDVGVTVEIREGSVFWDNGSSGIFTGSTQNVAALVTIEWAGLDPADPDRLQTFINYAGDETGPFHPLQWCTSFDVDTQVGVMPTGPLDDGTVGPVPWCLVSNTEVLDGGEIFQTQVLYGAGDPITFK